MNSLKANCSYMELVGRQLNELMLSFDIDNKELWLIALNQTRLLLYLVSDRAPFLAPCCFRCIKMISPRILNRKSDSLLMIVSVIVKLRMWRIQ